MGKLSTYYGRRHIAASLLACVALLTAMAVQPANALAANTHSYDFEESSDQSLSVSDTAPLSVTSDLTIEAWVKLESLPSSNNQYTIVSKNQSSGDERSYELMLYNSGSGYQLGLGLSDDGANGYFGHAIWSPSTDTWYHVAATYDASEAVVKVYVDGSQLGSTQEDAPEAINDSTSAFYIGSNPQGDDFDGKIDDVRVWSAVRSQGQISANKTKELTGGESDLEGYWKLNNSLDDETTNGADLTNNNSATAAADVPFVDDEESSEPSLTASKSSNETVTNSTTLQNDNDLVVELATNTTYIIDGVIFASTTSAVPDLKIAFTTPSGAMIAIGYTGSLVDGVLIASGAASDDISLLAGTPTWVHVSGTVTTTSTDGDLQLRWAQNVSDAAGTTVLRGSYIRAEAI